MAKYGSVMDLPKVGDWVMDADGHVGFVVSTSDYHNIEVLHGIGRSLYCLVEGCGYCLEGLWRWERDGSRGESYGLAPPDDGCEHMPRRGDLV